MLSKFSSTYIILIVTSMVFFTSLWHIKPWASVDDSIVDLAIPVIVNTLPPLKPPQADPVPTALDASPVVEEEDNKKSLSQSKTGTNPKLATSTQEDAPTFYQVAIKYGTDKVTTHSYHKMYQKYLGPIRSQPIKMLEIGLGCDMNYGPGKSYYTWLEWLPNVDLYFLEYDADCAAKWAKDTSGATVVAGDQADIPFLKSFMDKYGRDFDVIIDDGGHTMVQQRTSLDVLFEAIKPGGIYFCEDLQTSYWEKYGGKYGAKHTMVEYIKSFIDDLHMKGRMGTPDNKAIMSIDCMNEVCAFSKQPDHIEGIGANWQDTKLVFEQSYKFFFYGFASIVHRKTIWT